MFQDNRSQHNRSQHNRPLDNRTAPLFHAVITPHRSLTRRGVAWLLLGLGSASTLLSVPLYLMGAWPVIGFFGLDLGLLYALIRLNNRDARRREDVIVSYDDVSVLRIDPRGRRAQWRFNPLWVRLCREDIAEFGTRRLALLHRQQALEIAACLGSYEKADFAEALARALVLARDGPRYG